MQICGLHFDEEIPNNVWRQEVRLLIAVPAGFALVSVVCHFLYRLGEGEGEGGVELEVFDYFRVYKV